MLKVVDLQKIYNAGTETEVRALDGVTLEFPERGMVFLLGRSGSGKSTLLNVCGGLDAPSGGEIIVKGKSSRDFTQSDFDSYRNTFIGFIFQEYNILNEFSVEDNIALALELQGKPKDKDAVASILEQVDLAGYAKRKPNTLSGGQKQRIAIARALIKSPEIIMADEPTGALDSNTGKQVFDTLKKLSRDKLVIIVSHDREFAEQYGDRIIELKDGKILSDITKTTFEGDAVSENVNSLGDVLCIKKGADLTDADFAEIKKFLKKTEGDVLIANGEKSVSDFKKVSRIRDTGEKEIFAVTDESKMEKKQYTKDDAQFIRSRLPLRHAIRIGLSGLKSKPVRLMFTILLCTVAFVLFGLLSTLSFYDSEATFKQTLRDGDLKYMGIREEYTTLEHYYYEGELEREYNLTETARINDADLEKIRADFGNGVFGGVSVGYGFNFSVNSFNSDYYNPSVSTIAYLPEWNTLRLSLGTYPMDTDEIVLSSYLVETLKECHGNDANGNKLVINELSDVVGKKVNLNGMIYEVVGIIDSGELPAKFDELKNDETEGTDRRQRDALKKELEQALEDGLYKMIFVSKEAVNNFASTYGGYYHNSPTTNHDIVATMPQPNGTVNFSDYSNSYYMKNSEYEGGGILFTLEDGKTALSDGEAFITTDIFSTIINEARNNSEFHFETFDRVQTLLNKVATGYESHGRFDNDTGEWEEERTEYTIAQRSAFFKEAMTTLINAGITPSVEVRLWSNEDQQKFGDGARFTIVGLYVEPSNSYEKTRTIYLSDNDEESLWTQQKERLNVYFEYFSNYKRKSDAVYDLAYVAFNKSESQINTFWDIYSNEEFDENDSRLGLQSSSLNTLQMIDDNVSEMSQIFLYVGLVLAVFAALLFSNFISVSISQKKRDIGILRAVGARGTDVFKIFFSESFFISVICVILSTVGSFALCTVLNNEMAEGFGAALFVFGIPSFAVLVGIALVTAVVATFLPVFNAARRKPVDSIRAL